jgi:hypothetical protein
MIFLTRLCNFLKTRTLCLVLNLKRLGMTLRIYQTYLLSSMKLICNCKGNDVNLIKSKSVVRTFIAKLNLFKRNIGRPEMSQFPSLFQLEEQSWIKDDDILIYCDHLDVLHKDMLEQFEDLLNMEIPDWVINPFL